MQRRDNDLLAVFRLRRERYDEALMRANTILDAFGDATELLPKEHRVHVKSMREDGSPMPEPHPMYRLKPQGRDVRVFNDSSWVEDPFQLDDVDAEEQAELSEYVKRKDAKRSAQKAAEAKAAAAKAAAAAAGTPKNIQRRAPPAAVFEAGLHAMVATSGLDMSQHSSAVSPSETSLAVSDESRGVTPRTPRVRGGQFEGSSTSATPRAGGAVRRPSLLGGNRSNSRQDDDDDDDGDTTSASKAPETDLSHPSEVARKRRIIRKLWMGNVIQLRDLYASKAGGFHNIGGDGTADGSGGAAGIPLPTIEFQDNPTEDGAEVLDLADSEDTSLPGGIVGGGARRVPFSQRPVPPVPQFGSRSLAWITESVCHDMNAVTLSTENILRASLNSHTRRTGALDSEIQKCSYLARKSIAWCQGAALHASMYQTGEGIVSSGIVGEMQVQRREVVAVHEEVAQLQKQVDDMSATIESHRADIEVQSKRNAVLSFALDPHRVLDLDDRDTNSDHREAMIRLRQQLHGALAELKQKPNVQRRATVMGNLNGPPPSAMDLKEIDEAAQRLLGTISERYGGLKSMSTVTQWVMKAKGAATRRRATSSQQQLLQ
jgi:hypothetical protein